MLISGQAQIWVENLRACETFPLKFLLQQQAPQKVVLPQN